ncbi:MAG TPA: hypothetical protein IAB26_10345 [Candidatus Limivivens merdigallinarum]|uniref:Uncharacterized protein n=1 Tax=Candidatus Limivivens merdigallinarum TaxID=2840859 RepID=A0A9D1D0X5_9FIRM|nr:hypothetical protein [Candidatus Limivivens merdigallinarum]
MSEPITITPQNPNIPEQDAFILELQRLLACYQLASKEDRQIVWAALNKYVPHII